MPTIQQGACLDWCRCGQVGAGLRARSASPFSGDEIADTVDSTRVQHLFWSDPSPPGGAYTKAHLSSQCLRSMAVAVYGEGHPCRRRFAGNASIHVQVSRRAIERLGATLEGVIRAERLAVDGTVRDTARYSIVRDEWPAVKERLESL